MKIRKLIPLIIMAAFIAGAVVFLSLHGSIDVEELLDWSPENRWLAALVALAAYAVKSQTVVIPYAVIAAARSIYDGTEQVTAADLAIPEVIPLSAFRLIIHALLVARYGLDVLKITKKAA